MSVCYLGKYWDKWPPVDGDPNWLIQVYCCSCPAWHDVVCKIEPNVGDTLRVRHLSGVVQSFVLVEPQECNSCK